MLNHVLYLINIRVNIPTSYTLNFVLLSFAFMHLPAIHYPYLDCRDCNSCFVYYDGLVVLIICLPMCYIVVHRHVQPYYHVTAKIWYIYYWFITYLVACLTIHIYHVGLGMIIRCIYHMHD